MNLLTAIRNDDLDEVVRLLGQGSDPNELAYTRETPLMLAAIRGHVEIADRLLAHGADIDAADIEAQTALIYAVRFHRQKVAELLLERGADPSLNDWRVFHEAVEARAIPLVQRLLNMGADPNHQVRDQLTPLMRAARGGSVELVNRLLKAGADPFQTGQGGRTALDTALEDEHHDVVKVLEKRSSASGRTLLGAVMTREFQLVEELLAKGVPVNFRDPDCGYTPLAWAVMNQSEEVVRALIQAGADLEAQDLLGQTPLFAAMASENESVLRLLLAAGANCNHTDCTGFTVLESAIWNEWTEAIDILLDGGADPNAYSKDKATALHWAVAKGSIVAAQTLIDAGADLTLGLRAGDVSYLFEGFAPGTTPLMIAAQRGHSQLVISLLEHGANPKRVDERGNTAVDHATRAGRVDVLRILEEAGEKVNYKSRRLNNAALLLAVQQQDVAGVRRALDNGARTDVTEKPSKRTPLMLACLRDDLEIVQLLLDAGADPNQHTRRGEYPLTNGVVLGYAELVKALLGAGADPNVEYRPRSIPLVTGGVVPSRFCPLADAGAGGHVEIVELLLASGANVDLISKSGDSPLFAALTTRHFDLARRLMDAGAVPRDEDADYLDILDWDSRAETAEYQTALKELQEVSGIEPRMVRSFPGAHAICFSMDAEDGTAHDDDDDERRWGDQENAFQSECRLLEERIKSVFNRVGTEMTKRGFCLVDAGIPLGCGPTRQFLVLFPTSNPFAIMAALGTHGNEAQLSNRDLIQWFRRLAEEHPFQLRRCTFDALTIELDRPLDEPAVWATKLVKFDSDVYDDLARVKRELETATRLAFWWD